MTPSQAIEAMRQTCNAITDAIRDNGGSMPSGHLYAVLMGYMSLNTYEKIINALERAGRIRREGHLLFITDSPLNKKAA